MYGNTGRAGVWLIEVELSRVLTCCGGTAWIHWNCPVCSPERRTVSSPTDVDCALARYVARNAYRIARPSDLIAAMQTVAPDALSRMARFGVKA